MPNFNNQRPPEIKNQLPPGLENPLPIKRKSSPKTILLSIATLIILCFIAYYILREPVKPVEPPIKEQITKFYTIKNGEIFSNALRRCNVPEPLAKRAINALWDVRFDFRKCKAGDTIRIIQEFSKTDSGLSNQSVIRKIEYQMYYDRIYEINFDWMKTTVSMVYKEFELKTELVKGTISSSLYESLLKVGERADLAYNFADIFGWEIDFFVETQEGDSFFVLLEKKFDEHNLVDYGKIHLVRYKGNVGDFYGVYFEDAKGQKDYYDLEGKSLRKAFLRSPLRYSRISSYFSRARYHPILRIVRPHHGLDYVAPKGSPISAIGDGTVTFAGWKGSYGNLVEIAHKNGYKSRYGHLSGFASGIRKGRRVSQGQKVGYLGTTGLSTGPHLHFEVLQYGKWVNPLRIIPPRAEPIRKEYLDTFNQIRDQYLKQLAEINL